MSTILPIGPIMIDLEGTWPSIDEEKLIKHPNTGGVILFTRNYESIDQITALIETIRQIRGSDILIGIDQEGGRVQRFRDEFTTLPPANCYALSYPNDLEKALHSAESAGWLMASELLSVGIDFSFAPVLDIDSGISKVIGDRSFSKKPEIVTQLASLFRRGMKKAGMGAIGKHFPGHGGVSLDSHFALPEDTRSFEELMQKDLIPFCGLIEFEIEGIMLAHIIYSQIDPNSVCFSKVWIQEILRKRLGYDGAVFSDDLSMEGAACAGSHIERANKAVAAGCDMVLVCNQPSAARDVLENLPENEQPTRQRRLSNLLSRAKIDRPALLQNIEWQNISERLEKMKINLLYG